MASFSFLLFNIIKAVLFYLPQIGACNLGIS